MAFEPLGYRFEVHCEGTPPVVKEQLRGKMKPWFDPKTGARGWIVGPFLCLWQSAIDRYGPMVLARIRPDGHGTIITGRAGADLNGTLSSILFFSISLFAIVMAVIKGQASAGGALLLIAVIGIFLPLILWWGHKDRKNAEGLVRFVERTLGVKPASRAWSESAEDQSTPATASPGNVARPDIAGAASTVPVPGARLIVDGDTGRFAPSEAGLLEAVAALDEENFVILEFAEQEYMQAVLTPGGFWIEYRSGGPDRHFRCEQRVDRDSTAAFLLHYLATRQPDPRIGWNAMRI